MVQNPMQQVTRPIGPHWSMQKIHKKLNKQMNRPIDGNWELSRTWEKKNCKYQKDAGKFLIKIMDEM